MGKPENPAGKRRVNTTPRLKCSAHFRMLIFWIRLGLRNLTAMPSNQMESLSFMLAEAFCTALDTRMTESSESSGYNGRDKTS